MAALTTALADLLLDAVLRGPAHAYTGVATVYVALFTTPTNAAGGGTEVSTIGTAYARQAITFATAASNSTNNTGAVTFPTATGGGWDTVTHCAVMDAPTGGNMLFQGPLASPKTISSGDTMVVPLNLLVLTLA